MPLPIVGIAPLNGWRQIGAPHWTNMEQHTFEAVKGQLVHSTDGMVRAIVPPEGFADYLKTWPEAAPIVEQITKPAAPAAPAAASTAAE